MVVGPDGKPLEQTNETAHGVSDGFTATHVDLGIKEVTLVTGETIIGHVFLDQSSMLYRIEQPARAQMVRDEQGRVGVQLLPVRPWIVAEEPIDVSMMHVIFISSVVKDMQEAYRQKNSPIVQATPKDVSNIAAQKSTLDDLLRKS